MTASVFIGYDPREDDAFRVARASIQGLAKQGPVWIHPLKIDRLRSLNLYWRPHRVVDGQLYDVVSDAPMSTQFAISRFFTPNLQPTGHGWALFIDCDFMARADINELFVLADPTKAVMVVKHEQPAAESVKMDNQIQTVYARKNWSSMMLFNCDHPANKALTLEYLNSARGIELHQFGWLDDQVIGEIPIEWNHLVGVNRPNADAKLVHHTLGVPSMAGYENSEFAEEWFGWEAQSRE